ncbi:hypothetical protein QAD02_016916 [Eretmocerus hayati]|uniref:Uncharacterized protein n=1 Tax=Eretmocerus hayati TaxID=131215 RepID=A0ACC2PBY0_9HYME|nr:hypothetical protein QAD02_016916 [Eretmocerus hayati]
MLIFALASCLVASCHSLAVPEKFQPETFSTPTGLDLSFTPHLKLGVGVENGTFFVAQCGNHDDLLIKCKLSITRFLFDSSNKTETKSYSFSLLKMTADSIIAPYLQVFRFSGDKYIVSWIEYNEKSPTRVEHVDGIEISVGMFINFFIISTKTGETYECRTFGTALASKKIDWKDLMSSMFVHLRDKEFGVTYLYSAINGFAYEVFNSTGLRTLGPINGNRLRFKPNDRVVLSISNHPKNNEKCQSNWQTQERLRLAALFGNGTYEPSSLMRLNDRYPGGYSTANEIYSLCRKRDYYRKQWSCIQRKPNQALNTLQVRFNYEPKTAILYSLPRGDLLAMTTKQLTQDSYEVFLTVFDGSVGDAYLPVKFGVFSCNSMPMLSHLFRSHAEKYCLSVLPYTTCANFTVKCYSEETLFQSV